MSRDGERLKKASSVRSHQMQQRGDFIRGSVNAEELRLWEEILGCRRKPARAVTQLKPHATSPPRQLCSGVAGHRQHCGRTDRAEVGRKLVTGLCEPSKRRGWPAGLYRCYTKRNKMF